MARPRANAPPPPRVSVLTEWPRTPQGHFDSPGEEEWRREFIRQWRNLGSILMPLGATAAHASLAEDLADCAVSIQRMRAAGVPERTITSKERIRNDLKRTLFANALVSAAPPQRSTPSTSTGSAPTHRAFPPK